MLHERMHKQVPAWSLVVVAVGMLLLFAIGSGLYNSGWSNGLSIGLLAGGGDGAKLLTNPAYAIHAGWGHGHFFGGILHLLLFFFVMSVIFRIFRGIAWKMHRAHAMPDEGGTHSGQQPWGGPPWAHHKPHWQQPQPPQPSSEANVPITPGEEKPQNTSWVV